MIQLDKLGDEIAGIEDAMLSKMFAHTYEIGWAFTLKFFQPLHREVARGLLRKMASEGRVEFIRGLWNEDGMPAGSGYALTPETFRSMKKRLEKCATPTVITSTG